MATYYKGDGTQITIPSASSVDTAQLVDNAVTYNKLAEAVQDQLDSVESIETEIADVEETLDSLSDGQLTVLTSPLVATTASEMTNTKKTYVYTGSETGYTSGNWYYYNGSAWVSGGVYNSVAVQTDTTLSVSGMAADSEAVSVRIDDLKSDITDSINDIVTTNVIFRESSIRITGSGRYVYKDILTITDIDSESYTISVGNVTNATSTNVVNIIQQNSSGTTLRTTNLTANNSTYIALQNNVAKIIVRLYPAAGTALSATAVYEDVVVYVGKLKTITLNSDVHISQVDSNTTNIARLDKSLIAQDNVLFFSDKEVVNQYNNESGNTTYCYRDIYDNDDLSNMGYIFISIDSVTGATATQYATVYFLDENNSTVSTGYLGGSRPLKSSFEIPSGATKVKLRLYPSSTGLVTATYTNVLVCSGKEFSVSLSEAVKTYSEPIPDYYFDNNYLPNKVSHITAEIEKCASNGDAFIFITDQHWNLNAQHSLGLISYIKSNVNISKLFNGGDTADKGSFDFMNRLKKSFNKDVYSIVGNHDFMGWHSEDYVAYLFDDYSKDNLIGVPGKNYYYFDNHKQKLRYVILEAFRPLESSEGQYESHTGYTSEQISWLENTALNVESGWGIIILTHVLYGIDAETDAVTTVSADLVNAIDEYDGSGEIICVIQGHTHRDRITHTPGGIPVIITTCDKYQPYTSEGVTDINTTRTAGTITEQAFDVFVVNRNDRYVIAIRIGAQALNGVDDSPGTGVEYRTVSF